MSSYYDDGNTVYNDAYSMRSFNPRKGTSVRSRPSSILSFRTAPSKAYSNVSSMRSFRTAPSKTYNSASSMRSFRTALSNAYNSASSMRSYNTAPSVASSKKTRLSSYFAKMLNKAKLPIGGRKAMTRVNTYENARSFDGRNTRSMANRVNVERLTPKFPSLNPVLWKKSRPAKTFEFNQYSGGTLVNANKKVISVPVLEAGERDRIRKLFAIVTATASKAEKKLNSLPKAGLQEFQLALVKRYRKDAMAFRKDLVRQQSSWMKALDQMEKGKRGMWTLLNWPMTPLEARPPNKNIHPSYYKASPSWYYLRRDHQNFINRLGKSYETLLKAGA